MHNVTGECRHYQDVNIFSVKKYKTVGEEVSYYDYNAVSVLENELWKVYCATLIYTDRVTDHNIIHPHLTSYYSKFKNFKQAFLIDTVVPNTAKIEKNIDNRFDYGDRKVLLIYTEKCNNNSNWRVPEGLYETCNEPLVYVKMMMMIMIVMLKKKEKEK